MTELKADPFASHGGLLIPLEMFRVTMLAGVLGETLVSKARNIVDAKLILTRHPQVPLVLGRIEGSVVGDDPATFWRENADLALAASQALPRQVFLYYLNPGPANERNEGFVVAQRGQVLAADDASADTIPTGTPDAEWPVAKLCEQMRLDVRELASGFAGGPAVSVSLVEPSIDDQAALMTLAGQDEAAGDQPGAAGPEPAPGGQTAASSGPDLAGEADADAKRRAKEQAEEEASMRERAKAVTSQLEFLEDEHGIVVAPPAGLSEPELLRPFVVTELQGEVPSGLPTDLTPELQGKRIDVAVPVEFLSEVFVENKPLSRPQMEQAAQQATIAGESVNVLEVLAPRIGHGLLIAKDRSYVFVSRRPGLPLPEQLVAKLLHANG